MKNKTCHPDFAIRLPNHTGKDQRIHVLTQLIPYQSGFFSENDFGIRTGTKTGCMKHLILFNAGFTSRLPATATKEQKVREAENCLNDRKTRWRFIFNQWPRDPNGTALMDDNSLLGKMAGGRRGLIWGSTLADICFTKRLLKDSTDQRHTITSISKMYTWCKSQGELYPKAALLIDAAEQEEEPHMLPAFPAKELVQVHEKMMREGIGARKVLDEEGKRTQVTQWELQTQFPPHAPFQGRANRWPRHILLHGWLADIPPLEVSEAWTFDVNQPSCTLQDYIPQHLLPEKLFVHDPWKLLSANPWVEGEAKEDIVHTYKLKLSAKKTHRRAEDEKELADKAAKADSTRVAFLNEPHSNKELPEGMVYGENEANAAGTHKLGRVKPPIYVVFPSKPQKKQAPTAHLYLSAEERIGTGHHSYVHRSILEVPRTLLVEDEICIDCVNEDVKRILLDTDGPDGSRRDLKWDELSGEYIQNKTGKNARYIPLDGVFYQWEASTLQEMVTYEGPYRAIATSIGYQNLEHGPYCEHFRQKKMHPRTAKAIVAAKLSIQNDNHLAKEAENYQAFPKDFFEQYSGFNIIPPIPYPVPVSALVPQFYGYYVPCDDDRKGSSPSQGYPQEYLSPLLLIEECGTPIVPLKLTLDDRDECASLIYRLHQAGWVHNSLFLRNIVRQPGPLHLSPHIREQNALLARGGLGDNWAFRMIDFGRSMHFSDMPDEEWDQAVKYEDQKIKDWIQKDIPLLY